MTERLQEAQEGLPLRCVPSVTYNYSWVSLHSAAPFGAQVLVLAAVWQHCGSHSVSTQVVLQAQPCNSPPG